MTSTNNGSAGPGAQAAEHDGPSAQRDRKAQVHRVAAVAEDARTHQRTRLRWRVRVDRRARPPELQHRRLRRSPPRPPPGSSRRDSPAVPAGLRSAPPDRAPTSGSRTAGARCGGGCAGAGSLCGCCFLMHQAEPRGVPALEAFPQRDVAARAAGAPRSPLGRVPFACAGLHDQAIDVRAATGVVLHVTVEERGDEVQADGDQAVLAPHRVLEPVLVPQVRLHLGRRGAEAECVAAVQEREQVTIRVDRLVEIRARTGRVVDGEVMVASDQQQRRLDARDAFGTERAERAARRREGDDGLHVRRDERRH